jgi:very-short-patch-repair endonuclease
MVNKLKYLEQHNNYSYLKKYRKYLRKNLTPAERKLWSKLKNRSFFGLKFRRQFSFENYILDFVFYVNN